MATSLTDAEKAFLGKDNANYQTHTVEFKWEESEQWQHYYSNFFPAPPASKLPKYKRAWYRRVVDPNLPADSTVGDVDPPATSKSSSTTTAAEPAKETPRRTYFTMEMAKEVLVRLELAARLIFLVSTFLLCATRLTRILPVRHFMVSCQRIRSANVPQPLNTASTMSFFLFLIFAILKDHGKPKLSMDYVARVIGDSNILYIAFGAAVFAAPKSLVILAPQVVTCLIGLDKLYKNHHSLMPLILKADIFRNCFKVLDNYVVEMHTMRAIMEVVVLFHMIFGLVLGGWTIINVLLYSNFIKLKLARNDVYLISILRQVHGTAFQVHASRFADGIGRLLAHPSLPPVMRNVYQKAVALLQRFFMPRRP
ncbi:secy-independent transporter [Babesia ovata]|uniref:Secy-independent transporter n=1 Tax=Babesia ovata TaxID=189622 RepID=A0A2H6KD14_9APIC|nr:secy-independent transporter [Babesia ovata]GBE60882.1 secy-independent transporter [Babesia ovata]